MSPVEEKEGQNRKELGINRESGSERGAVLSWTMHCRVPPELVQPPMVQSLRGCSLFCQLSRLSSQSFPLAEFLALGQSVILCPELPQKRLEVVVALLRSQLAFFY